MSITSEIGIMQGRLSPKIDGKIQAFPVENWKNEFQIARQIGFSSIEWIVEQPLELNPLLIDTGIEKIQERIAETGVTIEYICADIFMHEPIINDPNSVQKAKNLLSQLIIYAKKINAQCVEIPFVDKSSIKNKQYSYLIDFFNSFGNDLSLLNIKISLETDLDPNSFKELLNELHPNIGANYDIGNSASLGYRFEEELEAYGNRIFNVHIKDRKLGGTTVPFGTGNANIEGVLNILSKINYQNGVIIQGARGDDDIDTAISQLKYTQNIVNKLNNA